MSIGLFWFICIFLIFYYHLCVFPLVLNLGRCSNNCQIIMVACRSQILFMPGCGATAHATLCSSTVVVCMYYHIVQECVCEAIDLHKLDLLLNVSLFLFRLRVL